MIEISGQLVGVVSVESLLAVPASERPTREAGTVAVPASRLPAANPDEALADVLERAGDVTAIPVVEHGRFVGLVTPRDIAWAARQAALRRVAEPTDDLTPRW